MNSRKPGQSWASQKQRKVTSKAINNAFDILKRQFKKTDKESLIKNAMLLLVALFLFGAIVFLGMFAWLSRDLPDPNSLSMREVAQSTKIYDRTGEVLLYEISGDEKRTLVELSQIPDHVKWATISAEDRKFYEHGGIDYKGIARAIFKNVTSFDPTGEGASTITQQLVKNAILTTEQTYTRKIKEIVLAFALERRYTKDEILQLYLNEIPYGSTNYGIESASLAYFGKHVSDLTIAEGATIAALPQAPSMFLNNPDRLKARRDWIIRSMVDLKYISEDEGNTALEEVTDVELSLTGIKAPHFVLWVKEALVLEFGERMVEQGGLVVTTSLDAELQKIAETAVENNKTERSSQYGFNNSGLVSIDPKTGDILAMVGSADYFDDEIDGQVNITTRPLQPGSSFKPIVYTAAFEKGYTPNTVLWDAETTFGTATGAYSPRNYDLKEHGQVTIRKALQGSLNIPAVKTLYLVGVENALDFAERLHYTTFEDRSDFGLAIVLGGAEVKLLDHVAAYATFASDGVYHEPRAVLKVQSAGGDVLKEVKDLENPEGEKVLEPNITRMISNVLSDNNARTYAFGAYNLLTIPGRQVATKTGTTNDYKDAWTVGYTPNLVAGVWTGNTGGQAMARGAGGSTVAAPIWNEFMRLALQNYPQEYFTEPQITKTGIPVLDGEIPSQKVIIDTSSGKLATELTPERFKEEKICGDFHSILHYIDKYNPLGGIIEKSKDPYYESWEKSIQEYIVRSNEKLEEGETTMEICEVPTEFDDLHTESNKPKISIKTPDNNQSVGRLFQVEISANAPRGVNRIEYLIDGKFVKLGAMKSTDVVGLPGWVGIGSHTLSVLAYDDIDNVGEDSISIKVTEEGTGTNFKITNPFENQTIEKTDEAYLIAIENSSNILLNSIIVSKQNAWTGVSSIISEINNPDTFTAVHWTLPEPAEYLLSAKGVDIDGNTIETVPVRVLVKDVLNGNTISVLEEETPTE